MTDLDLLTLEAPPLLGRELTGEERARFERYQQLLREWNERVNLTAIVDPIEIQRRHFLDSLACLRVLTARQCEDVSRAIDVGAGAGLPGVPLKIVCPRWHLTLLDSVGKKTAFLRQLVDELQLREVDVLTGRAEDLARDPEYRERYDIALARALAPLNVLVEYCLPFVRIGGVLVAHKKANIGEEVAAASSAVRRLGGQIRPDVRYRLPGLDEERLLVVVEKVAPTPAAYPRRAGVPAKQPLR